MTDQFDPISWAAWIADIKIGNWQQQQKLTLVMVKRQIEANKKVTRKGSSTYRIWGEWQSPSKNRGNKVTAIPVGEEWLGITVFTVQKIFRRASRWRKKGEVGEEQKKEKRMAEINPIIFTWTTTEEFLCFINTDFAWKWLPLLGEGRGRGRVFEETHC